MDVRVARLVALFESLREVDLPALVDRYAEDATFKDPFNDVRGRVAIERVYAHMFKSLDQPHFVVHEVLGAGDRWVLRWDFVFAMRRWRRSPITVHGVTHLVLDAGGRIVSHRDYWDAAEELYGQLPWLGGVMRWLQRRVRA